MVVIRQHKCLQWIGGVELEVGRMLRGYFVIEAQVMRVWGVVIGKVCWTGKNELGFLSYYILFYF